ncbi:MAG: alpha/beta hydrolase [Amphiplicatus sp.]
MTVIFLLLLVGALAAVQGCATLAAEKIAPPIGKFVEIGGERIHLVDLAPSGGGEGPPVVLIHGASVNLRDMKLALGDELSKSRRVVMIDRPGRGYSTRPDEGWRIDEQATLIYAALVELGVERPVIVGQSFGGAVALAYTLKFQDDMTGLVLLAPVSHEWPGGVAWYNTVSGWPVAGFLLRRLVIPVYAPIAAKPGVAASFAPDEAPQDYYEKSGLTLLFRPGDFRSNAADLRNLKPQIVEMSRHYGEIRVPVAILTGISDTTVSPKIHAMALARDIRGASLDLLPDTGHALHHSQTAKIIAAIEQVASAGN